MLSLATCPIFICFCVNGICMAEPHLQLRTTSELKMTLWDGSWGIHSALDHLSPLPNDSRTVGTEWVNNVTFCPWGVIIRPQIMPVHIVVHLHMNSHCTARFIKKRSQLAVIHNLHYEIMSPDHLQNVLLWLKQTELQIKLMHLQRNSAYSNTDSKVKLSERRKAQRDTYDGNKNHIKSANPKYVPPSFPNQILLEDIVYK